MLKTAQDRLAGVSEGQCIDWCAILVCHLGLVFYLIRYILIQGGRAKLWGDVTCCWQPLGRALANGTPLYLAEVTSDNKPPLWELIAGVGGLVNDVGLVLLVVNGLGAWGLLYLTYQYGKRLFEDRLLAIISQFIVFSIIAAIAFMTNNKLPGAALIFAALYVRRPLFSGILAALSINIVQYTLLAVPLIGVLWWYRDGEARLRNYTRYLAGVVSVFIGIWGLVAALYGLRAVWAGFEQSFLVIFDYFFAVRGPPEDPDWWLNDLMEVLGILQWQIALAAGGVIALVSKRARPANSSQQDLVEISLVGLVLLPSVLVKAFNHYFALLALPLGIFVVFLIQGIQVQHRT